jgi:uncharacterized protein YfaS (alpha-2-macroglobulin family)
LPAGFEIVNSDATQSSDSNAKGYPWLKNLTGSGYFSEARDDRYIASTTLDRNVGTFAAAYVVRAVTPGEYKYPALDVEDMYDPETVGRGAIGKLVVSGR